jgi:hypothetical protein
MEKDLRGGVREMSEPHPLSCENGCKKFWRHNLDCGCKNSGSIWNLTKETMAWIRDVGCASHSDITTNKSECDVNHWKDCIANYNDGYAVGWAAARKFERERILKEAFDKLMEKRFSTELSESYIVWSGDVEGILDDIRDEAQNE